MQYQEFGNRYPYMLSKWSNGEDPSFPNGENTNQVLSRLLSFLDETSKTLNKNNINSVSIFTHNGVLRCLILVFPIFEKNWF